MGKFIEVFMFFDLKKSILAAMVILLLPACSDKNQIPVMGDHVVFDVDIHELSGLCFNADKTALIACGDKGDIKSVSFEGAADSIYSLRSDMEGITIDPSTDDLYMAIERQQVIDRLAAPEYSDKVTAFAVEEAVSGKYENDGLEAVEYYKDDILFVGSQFDANLWQYKTDGTELSKVSLSSFASEIAGLSYDPEADWLWVTDSETYRMFICTVDGRLLATYDVPFIKNAESVCVDRERGCVWIGSDEKLSKLYKIEFRF